MQCKLVRDQAPAVSLWIRCIWVHFSKPCGKITWSATHFSDLWTVNRIFSFSFAFAPYLQMSTWPFLTTVFSTWEGHGEYKQMKVNWHFWTGAEMVLCIRLKLYEIAISLPQLIGFRLSIRSNHSTLCGGLLPWKLLLLSTDEWRVKLMLRFDSP